MLWEFKTGHLSCSWVELHGHFHQKRCLNWDLADNIGPFEGRAWGRTFQEKGTAHSKALGQGRIYVLLLVDFFNYQEICAWYGDLGESCQCKMKSALCIVRASLVANTVKNLPAVWETWVRSLSWEDPLEEGMATHSSILAWRIPMDRGTGRATVHGVAKSRTWLSD